MLPGYVHQCNSNKKGEKQKKMTNQFYLGMFISVAARRKVASKQTKKQKLKKSRQNKRTNYQKRNVTLVCSSVQQQGEKGECKQGNDQADPAPELYLCICVFVYFCIFVFLYFCISVPKLNMSFLILVIIFHSVMCRLKRNI